ncbi:aminotransferase class IV [Micrococcales bacterium 31B]|nr:aminotransferase class IV [Micrococcales bacterium 31B]
MSEWHWAEGQLSPGEHRERAVIVDSWLTEGGHTRGLDLHAERFARGCREVGLASDDLDAFLAAVSRALPSAGRHFPRIACSTSGELSLQVRPAPSPSQRAVLQVREDTRQAPHWKGPDIPHLVKLREEAISHGATDAVLVDSDGFVVEAATAAVVWWEGGTLMSSASTRVMPSVTAALLRRLAIASGVEVATALRRPEDLVGHEVWCVNSVHPVRRVESIFAAVDALQISPVGDGESAKLANIYRRKLLSL